MIGYSAGQVLASIVIGLGGGVTLLGLLIFVLKRVYVLGDNMVDKKDFEKVIGTKADRNVVELEMAHGNEQFAQIRNYMKENDLTTKQICLAQRSIQSSIRNIEGYINRKDGIREKEKVNGSDFQDLPEF